ncbi:MAG: HAD-IIB family hydrolase [Nitrospirae bacterium]|nr:MAG: HAD-IIB family hydrolase [Nitrospirota bacterium]
MTRMVVFTDLDGSLLDAATYSFEAAREALAALRDRNVPLVLASSKTKAEMDVIRSRLGHTHPFVVENGGGVFIPAGLFHVPIPNATPRRGCQVVELGTAYAGLRRRLKEIAQVLGFEVRGFGDMSVAEVAERAGLDLSEAAAAKQREYDEPFVFDGPAERIEEFRRQAETRGLRCVKGGRFHHLMGRNDKGSACRLLIDCYRRQFKDDQGSLITVAIGDSLNDLPMLAVVDRPVLVQKPDGSYEPDIRLPNLTLAPGIGPVGWNAAVLQLINRLNGGQEIVRGPRQPGP